MILAQGRFWCAEVRKGADEVSLSLLRDAVKEACGDEHEEIRELRIDVPLGDWTRVVKHLSGDRKLLGGILLDFARNKDALPAAIGRDRVFHGLQEVVRQATTGLVEEGLLVLVPPKAAAGR